MNPRCALLRLLLGLLACACAARVFAAAASDLTLPEKRRATVDLAARLLAPVSEAATKLPEDLTDPFHPAGFVGAASTNSASPNAKPTVLTGQALLEAVAPKIIPSGTIAIGDTPYLLFGEKRLKVGDYLTIAFEGRDYVLQIADIQSTAFTLRLNNATVTRPIKGNTP